MRTRRDRQKGQSSVEYTLLLAFLVFSVTMFATGYYSSMSGVNRIAKSTLAAAGRALQQAPDNSIVTDTSEVEGWNHERPITPRSLADKLGTAPNR